MPIIVNGICSATFHHKGVVYYCDCGEEGPHDWHRAAVNDLWTARWTDHETGDDDPRVMDLAKLADRLTCGCRRGCPEHATTLGWDGAERCPTCGHPVGGYVVTIE